MRKLKDERGATLLMALLLLLVASTVSVVILTSATTAAQHLESDRASQQAYLTVSSAAELIRDDILNSSFVQETVQTVYSSGTVTETTNGKTLPTGFMAEWLKAGKKAVEQGRNTPYKDTITLSTGMTSDMANVIAEFTMTEDYDITIVLHLADGGSDCRLVLTLTGLTATENSELTDSTNAKVTTTTTTLSWPAVKAAIEKEAGK